MIKRNDIILFGAVILLALIAIFAFHFMKTNGSKVVITVGGKEYETLNLNKDTTFTIKQANGDFNKVVIKDGTVDMTDANCPDKICVNHSKIHYNGETIVCLPHKVVVEIKNGKDNPVDVTAK